MKVPTEAEMQAMRERLEIRGSSLWWKVQPRCGKVDLTKPAGTPTRKKYILIRISTPERSTKWSAHRIAWFLHYGAWPACMIDHKDQDKQNNNPENLREATESLNKQNTGLLSTNTTGIKGVSKHGTGYRVKLTVNAVEHRKYLSSLQEAIDYRKELEKTYHPWSPSVA